jgi:hypothetical protein
MCRSGTTTRRMTCAAVALLAWSTPLRAQVLTDDKWHFAVTPYVWLVGLGGDVGVRRLTSSVDLKPWEVLKHLQFGAMAYAEARKGPYGVGLDGIYAKLGDAKAIAVRGDTGALDIGLHMTILQPTGGYTIGDSTWSVAFLLGMRYWNLSPSFDVRFPRLSNERSGTGQWVDATGGARLNYVWSGKLHLIAAADGGGGGSKDTWQVLGSAAYDAWSNWNLGVAYRTLAVNRDHDNIVFDTRFKGFMLGATYHTW